MKNKIKEYRFFKGEITQQQLAEAVGVSRQTIHAIEHDKFTPSVKLAMLISRFFQTTVEELFIMEKNNE